MGSNLWRWLVVVLLLGAVAVTGSSLAFGEDKADTGTSESSASAQPAKDPTPAEDTKAEEELPPLDLGTGTTADPESTVDPLAEGVTVSNADKPDTSATGATTPAKDPLDPVVPPMWTPRNERFLLRDRQETLSLGALTDQADTGAKTGAAAPKPATKPATKPAAKPATKPSVKPAPKQTITPAPASPVQSNPATDIGPQVGPVPSGLVDDLGLPDDGGGSDGVIPSEQFSEREQLSGESDSFVLDGEHGLDSPAASSLGLGSPAGTVGIINPRGTPGTADETRPPSLRESLANDGASDVLGTGIQPFPYWRGAAIFLALLSLIFLGAWASKRFRTPFGPLANKPLSVLETISLGAGRQITIVEMAGCALVLGVTPQSINLLDKVPLSAIQQSYKGTVNAIIDKESHALPDDWAQRPRFTVPENTGSAQLVPPLSSAGTYGPNGQRVSVSELRRSRAESGPMTLEPLRMQPGYHPGGDEQTKTELIGRLRDQLSRLER